MVSKCLALLCLVPVQNQAIPERQGRSSVCSRLIAVEQRARKGSFDVTNSLLVEFIRRGERLGHLLSYQYPTSCNEATPQSRYSNGRLTYELPPGFTLRLWNAVLDGLDLTGAETGHSSLVLWTTEGWSNRPLQVSERSAGRRTALAGPTVVSRHLEDVNCRER